MIYNKDVKLTIPKGWRVETLDKIALLIMGLSPNGKSYNVVGKGIPLLNGAADFKTNMIKPTKYTTSPNRVSKRGDLLLCIRGTIGNLIFADKTYCLGRGVASIRPKSEIYSEFIYFTFYNKLHYLTSRANGSVISGLSKQDILYKIAFDEQVIQKFHGFVQSIFNKTIQSKKTTVKVSQIRDVLLPTLMSGKISVTT